MNKNTIIAIMIFIHLANSAISEIKTTWQKDGRNIALGGGMNAIEQSHTSGVSLNYCLPYGLKELSCRSLCLKHIIRQNQVEGYWAQTGDDIYQENYFSIGVSRNLSSSIMLGIKTGYYHYDLICGEKGGSMLAEIQCSYKPYEKMRVSLYLFNPSGAKIRKKDEKIAMEQGLSLGLNLFPTKKVEWLLEAEKTIQFKTIWHMGFEYSLHEKMILRTGFSANPLKPSWGIGGQINHFKYALGGNIHPTLGFSSCFTLAYHWQK